jgi:predicted nuclease with TOPRIM domain
MPKNSKKKTKEIDEKMISDMVNRQIEMAGILGEMKATLKSIDEHTSVMNTELGVCKEEIAKSKEEIKDLKDRFILKLSWKQVGLIIGGTGTLVSVVYTLLKIIVFHSV